MSLLGKFLYGEHIRALIAEGEARRLGEAIFTEWRNLYLSALFAYMRLHDKARTIRQSGIMQGPSLDWCNAAALILDSGEPELQDRFLRADEKTKDRMVDAVQRDGGLETLSGVWVELPV